MKNRAGEEQHEPKVVGPGLWPALKAAASDWSAHKSAKAGAAIAYYSIFSLGPLIVVVISIAALIFGREGVQREVTEAIRSLLGDKGGESVNTMLSAAGKPSEGIFASIIGTVTLIFAAVGVVVQLKEALNVVWEVKPKTGGGIWGVRPHLRLVAGGRAHAWLPVRLRRQRWQCSWSATGCAGTTRHSLRWHHVALCPVQRCGCHE